MCVSGFGGGPPCGSHGELVSLSRLPMLGTGARLTPTNFVYLVNK